MMCADDPCDICVWLDNLDAPPKVWCSTCHAREATVDDKCARCAPTDLP